MQQLVHVRAGLGDFHLPARFPRQRVRANEFADSRAINVVHFTHHEQNLAVSIEHKPLNRLAQDRIAFSNTDAPFHVNGRHSSSCRTHRCLSFATHFNRRGLRTVRGKRIPVQNSGCSFRHLRRLRTHHQQRTARFQNLDKRLRVFGNFFVRRLRRLFHVLRQMVRHGSARFPSNQPEQRCSAYPHCEHLPNTRQQRQGRDHESRAHATAPPVIPPAISPTSFATAIASCSERDKNAIESLGTAAFRSSFNVCSARSRDVKTPIAVYTEASNHAEQASPCLRSSGMSNTIRATGLLQEGTGPLPPREHIYLV